MSSAVDAYYADLARWVRKNQSGLCSAKAGKERLVMDLHHLYYFLLRCEALGVQVGDLDREVGPPLKFSHTYAPAHARTLISDVQSLFSVQDTIQSVHMLWGTDPQAADPNVPFRFLYRIAGRICQMDLYSLPQDRLEGYEDVPGENGVPLRIFSSLTDLRLIHLQPFRLVGWDRLCVQLSTLQCTKMQVSDITDLFVGLVLRDMATSSSKSLPSAAWHALRSLNLADNELTFVPSSATMHFSSLVHLDLSENLLNAVPPALADLRNLRALNLAGNLIDSVLGIYDSLPAIRSLNLASNRLESLCGVERLSTLQQLDLRKNQIMDPAEIGRLAALPHISHVWIKGNPLCDVVDDVRVACFTFFAKEKKDIALDDELCGFFERRRVAEQVAKHVASTVQPPDTSIEAQVSSRVRRVNLTPSSSANVADHERKRRPRRTDPGPGMQASFSSTTERQRKPRKSELPRLSSVDARRNADSHPGSSTNLPHLQDSAQRAESLKQRIERLRGDAGDDWLREFARRTYDEDVRSDDRSYPVHAIVEDCPQAQESVFAPFQLALSAVSNPIGAALTTSAVLIGGRMVYVRYLRRYATAGELTPKVFQTRRILVGKATTVGDADGFRFYHTPGLPLIRSIMHPVPTSRTALKNQTISVRIAGVDAPEAAHFGREAQPYAEEAKAELQKLVEGKTVWLDLAHIDQYQRLVATPYVFRWPYIFGRTNVSLSMVRKGFATVYRSAGAAYGSPSFLQKTLLQAKSGRRMLERAEEYAKVMRLGMWSHGRNIETPAEYKRRMRE
ncbi:micrococcal nuclease [Malassezia yamatoensis]|uniref:Micrococcal nuclease n=1 Tax=Malassezia yamatoensis TaxID=253288 RepID=A0AAJ5YWX8_9BASI|nr:micrococcal nuclease [Malassezia yamatoensis]